MFSYTHMWGEQMHMGDIMCLHIDMQGKWIHMGAMYMHRDGEGLCADVGSMCSGTGGPEACGRDVGGRGLGAERGYPFRVGPLPEAEEEEPQERARWQSTEHPRAAPQSGRQVARRAGQQECGGECDGAGAEGGHRDQGGQGEG